MRFGGNFATISSPGSNQKFTCTGRFPISSSRIYIKIKLLYSQLYSCSTGGKNTTYDFYNPSLRRKIDFQDAKHGKYVDNGKV